MPPPTNPVLVPNALEPWLGREMSGVNDVERFAFGTVFGNLIEDPHPSEILATRSEPRHRLGELYEDMPEKDTDLGALASRRRDAVLALPRYIVPADASPQAKEVAEFCATALGQIRDLAINLDHQLDSRPKGIAIDELVWERMSRGPLARAIVPVAMIDRPMWRFAFKKGVLHIRQAGTTVLIPAPPGKFLVFRHGTKDSPWGKALYDGVYWYWFIKKHGWKWFAHFVEKWAAPTALVKYQHRTGTGDDRETANLEQQQKALQLAEAIQGNNAAAVPADITAELIEAARGGNSTYGEFIEMCTRGMALRLNGEINTSGLRPGTGAFASDKIADGVRKEKVTLDAHDIGAHIKDSLLRPMVDVNFGPDVAAPRFECDVLELEDRKAQGEGIKLLLENKQPVTKRHIYRVAGAPEPGPGEEVVEAPTAPPAPPVSPPPAPSAAPPADPNAPAPPDPGAKATAPATVHLSDAAATEIQDLVDEAAGRDEALSEIPTAFVPLALDYYATHQALALEAFDQGFAGDGTFLQWMAARLDATANADRLEAAQIHAIGLTFEHLAGDGITEPLLRTARADEKNGRIDLPMGRFSSRLSELTDFSKDITPEAALDYWLRRLDLPRSVFEQLLGSNRIFARMVSGLNDAKALTDVNALVQRAAAESWTRDQFRKALTDSYDRAGLTPTSSWHADLIYSNGTRTAAGVTRYMNTVGNPAARRLIPYLIWLTFGDDRVRARPLHNHLVMANLVFAIEHEIWNTWSYPAGHGCRCLVGTINRARAQRMGLVGAEPTGPWPTVPEGGRALPDPGFAGAPDLGIATGLTRSNLEDLLAGAQSDGGADLVAALRSLLQRILGFDPFAAAGLSEGRAA